MKGYTKNACPVCKTPCDGKDGDEINIYICLQKLILLLNNFNF